MNDLASQPDVAALVASLRATARAAPESGIVEAMNYGRGRPGLIPLWAGEGDMPTPAFIAEAATRSLAAGETFYTWQRGIPELRAALARYHARLYGRPFAAEEFFITGSGMQAIAIALFLVPVNFALWFAAAMHRSIDEEASSMPWWASPLESAFEFWLMSGMPAF